MNINIHCTTSSQDTSTFRRMMLLVTCLFVGSFIGMGVVGIALADDDDRTQSSGGPKNTFNIMMNYELGMHCTGFEFAYCCVLPPYNSILAQVVKTQRSSSGQGAFAKLLQGDPNVGKDALGRETVLRDSDLSGSNFQKYVLTYWHEAQPRDGSNPAYQGPFNPNNPRLISAVEGNSLFMWSTIYDQAATNPDGSLVKDTYNGSTDVVVGNGGTTVPIHYDAIKDSYANGWMNHLYVYADLEGSNPNNSTLEKDKIRLGLDNTNASTPLPLVFPPDCGPAAHPMGPVTTHGLPMLDKVGNVINEPEPNNCGGYSKGNLLTFSGEHGTIVYTQMKVLENLPITLTSPRIWEALGLPLTPFEDSINFFADPGAVDEDSIRPYVAMKAQLHRYNPADDRGVGAAVLQNGNPVVGFGTAPIDIPNCERCHSNGPDAPNSPQANNGGQDWKGEMGEQWALVQAEYAFWNAYYDIDTTIDPVTGEMTDSDWYSRLKSAAVSMMVDHDNQHGTFFTTGGDGAGVGNPDYPVCGGGIDASGDFDPDMIDKDGCNVAGVPVQNTRMGHEAVICQKCHADNVIAVVKSATGPEGQLIRPISEAIHRNHRSVNEEDENGELGVITFNDGLGRDGGCQGCHPAHRSDGDMDGYPITLDGQNLHDGKHLDAEGRPIPGDNRLAAGGCFVGRDVHSNRLKDDPLLGGADTPEHLNAVGAWLSKNVFDNQAGLAGDNQATRGIWCTNCHTQLGQEVWKAEDCENLIEGDCLINIRGGEVDPAGDVETPLNALLTRINLTIDDVDFHIGPALGRSWLDPKGAAGDDLTGTILSADGVDRTHDIWRPADPSDPYTQDANVATIEVSETPAGCGSLTPVDFTATFKVYVCVHIDGDGDPSVNVLSFCTTEDCVKQINDPANRDNEDDWRYPEKGKVDGMAGFAGTADTFGAAVPFNAATDGRDHWLSAGEPHCADCHAAPYVEQSGNINAFAPFNYPAKASLMRYSRGHRDITCQGCHESIHGLYPVTPNIDTTTYAQAASMNSDGSHGPLKCGACHQVNSNGVHSRMDDLVYDGQRVRNSLDAAIGFAHVFTDDHSPLDDMCQNCHGDERDEVSVRDEEWQQHAMRGRASRLMMNQVEIELLGAVAGTDPTTGEGDANLARSTVCRACHGDEFGEVSCGGEDGREWKRHLSEGRVAQTVWEAVSRARTRSTCGW